MKNKKYVTFLIIAVFFSSLSFGITSSLKNTLAVQPNDGSETTMQPNMLGDIDFLFETPVGLFAIEYLNGFIYGVDGIQNKLYVFDAVTGVNTANHTIPTTSIGITTDGTDLYISRVAGPNGTIIKIDTNGNEISRKNITIGAGSFGDLAWDGNYIWAYPNTPNLLRIDYDTGIVTRDISVSLGLLGLTWYNNKLWGEDYMADRAVGINPVTGAITDTFPAPYHRDGGLANNGTHFIQSRYLDISDPYAVSFTKIASEPGEILSGSIMLLSNIMDITYDDTDFFYSENGSSWINVHDGITTLFADSWDSTINPVGLTIMDDVLVVSSENAPFNLYAFSKDGTMMANHTALDVMIKSLAYDGTYLWAMGQDSVLYKLDPSDMSIVSEYAIGYFFGITYDYVNNVIWAVSKEEHKIKYFDPVKEQLGNNVVNLTTPITTAEYGLTFDGEFLVISTASGGGYFYRIIPCEIDEEPPTETPTPTPGGLFPGLSSLVEDLIFMGIGMAAVGIIVALVVILKKAKK